MRFASLASGSRGNALLLEAGGSRLLLDCGLPLRELESRLGQLGVAPESLEGVLVTHEHQDHLRGLAALVRRHRIPFWTSAGTCRGGDCGELPGLHLITPHQPAFRIGGIQIQPFPIPHDAREPAQFLLAAEGLRLGVLTDAGEVTPHLFDCLQGCDALLLECNHDPQMLATGPYPPFLRRRVGGLLGHLSNPQAAALLRRLDAERLRHLVAAHLSEKNNRPELAVQALVEAAPGLDGRIGVALQGTASGWFEL